MSRRPGLHAPKRDGGTARRLHNFGIGGQLVGVGARASLARDPDGWRYFMRIDDRARYEQESVGGSVRELTLRAASTPSSRMSYAPGSGTSRTITRSTRTDWMRPLS